MYCTTLRGDAACIFLLREGVALHDVRMRGGDLLDIPCFQGVRGSDSLDAASKMAQNGRLQIIFSIYEQKSEGGEIWR